MVEHQYLLFYQTFCKGYGTHYRAWSLGIQSPVRTLMALSYGMCPGGSDYLISCYKEVYNWVNYIKQMWLATHDGI